MEEENVDPAYIKGFNEGYTLAQHLPDLAKQLSSIENNSPRYEGLKAGRAHYVAEKNRERLPGWLKEDRLAKDQPSAAKSKGRDIEPDK